MFRRTVLDDQSCNVDKLSAEFRCCSQLGQVAMFHRAESGMARKIHRQYEYVVKVCHGHS